MLKSSPLTLNFNPPPLVFSPSARITSLWTSRPSRPTAWRSRWWTSRARAPHLCPRLRTASALAARGATGRRAASACRAPTTRSSAPSRSESGPCPTGGKLWPPMRLCLIFVTRLQDKVSGFAKVSTFLDHFPIFAPSRQFFVIDEQKVEENAHNSCHFSTN